MKRSRSKCEPLVGINNQLAIGTSTTHARQSKSAKLELVFDHHPEIGCGQKTTRKRRSGDGTSAASCASTGSGGALSSSGSDFDTSRGGEKPVQQRNAANARERQRMRILSRAFCNLKTSLPWVPPDTKLSKLDTLRLASGYIAYLKRVLDDDAAGGEAGASSTVTAGTKSSSNSRSGKQNSVALSAASASTSKLLSMALPSLNSSQNQNLPLMAWPFVSRAQGSGSNNTSGGGSSVVSSCTSKTANSGHNNTNSGSSHPRQQTGSHQLNQFYAQFKDRLSGFSQPQQQQAVAMATQQIASKAMFASPSQPNFLASSTSGFSSPSPWSALDHQNPHQSIAQSNTASFQQKTSSSFCSQIHQLTNYPASLNPSIIYSSSPPNQQCQQQSTNGYASPSSFYYASNATNKQSLDCSNFLQLQTITKYNHSLNMSLRKPTTGCS